MEITYLPQTSDSTDGPSAKRRRVEWSSEAELYNVDSLEGIPVYKVVPRDVGGAETLNAVGVGEKLTGQQVQALEEQQRAEAEAWEQEERRKFRIQQELYEVIY